MVIPKIFSDSTPGPSNQPDAGPVTPAPGPSENLESSKTLMPPAPQLPIAKKGNPTDSSSNNGGKGPKDIISTPYQKMSWLRCFSQVWKFYEPNARGTPSYLY